MGAIIGPNGSLLHLVDGHPGHVDFPEEVIWNLHKGSPGVAFELAHTHPPEMTELSQRDKQTLKTWCFALAPFPLRMSTITEVRQDGKDYKRFQETVYFGSLESKEGWIARGKPSEGRKFEVILYSIFRFTEFDMEDWMYKAWEKLLIERSYG